MPALLFLWKSHLALSLFSYFVIVCSIPWFVHVRDMFATMRFNPEEGPNKPQPWYEQVPVLGSLQTAAVGIRVIADLSSVFLGLFCLIAHFCVVIGAYPFCIPTSVFIFIKITIMGKLTSHPPFTGTRDHIFIYRMYGQYLSAPPAPWMASG